MAGTDEAMRFIAEELSPDSYVNVMEQYRPAHKVVPAGGQGSRYPELARRLTPAEYAAAVRSAQRHGLHRLA
jgi:putative pyruvate formate lyase activating enzyme